MSLVAGFNHNIKHRGQVFHVQTEDTGDGSAVVVTHLFLGGTIVATRRASYVELRGTADLQQQVRLLMEEQHKAVLRDLVNGKFDGKIEGLTAYQPGQLALRESAGPAGAVPVHRTPPPPPAENRAAANTTLFDIDVVLDDLEEEAPPAAANRLALDERPAPGRATVFDRAPAQGRATRFDDGVVPAASGKATLFDNGVVGGGQPPQQAKPQRPWPPQPRPPITPGPVATLTPQPGFGEELISEKSLDEVILAYLAGDRDED